MSCGDCLRICFCCSKCWECCCPMKGTTDRYAHIEYKPAETARRSRVVSDYELVAIQREPLQSYRSKPELTSVRPESKPSYHQSKSTSYKESAITKTSYQLQSERTPKPSKSESFRQRSQTLPSSAGHIQKPYHLELERISAVPKLEPSHQRSSTISLPTSHTVKPYHVDPLSRWTSVVPKSKPSPQHSKTLSSSVGHIHEFQHLKPEQTSIVPQPEPLRQRSNTVSSSTHVLSEYKALHQQSRTLDSTISHSRSKSLQPQSRASKPLSKQQSAPPYWMAVNGSPRNSASPELSVESSLIDDAADISEKKIHPLRSLPTYLKSRRTSYTIDSATNTPGPALSADKRLTPRVPIVQFSLEHDSEQNTLTVRLIQAKNLPAKDIGGSSDPFVKLSLESKVCEFFESKVMRRTLNPKFNQSFKFTNLPSKIHHEKLVLEIYDYDRMLVNDFIGEVRVSLKKELLNGDTITMKVDELARELRVCLLHLLHNDCTLWLIYQVGVASKSCNFSPQQQLTMLRSCVNKFNPLRHIHLTVYLFHGPFSFLICHKNFEINPEVCL